MIQVVTLIEHQQPMKMHSNCKDQALDSRMMHYKEAMVISSWFAIQAILLCLKIQLSKLVEELKTEVIDLEITIYRLNHQV